VKDFQSVSSYVDTYLARIKRLDGRYRAGEIHARTPEPLRDLDRPLAESVAACLPASRALLEGARGGLFFSLPIAFDPGEGIGCYLATVDRDPSGEPYRFLDMGAGIATRAFGENDAAAVEAVLRELPAVVNRYAHSEYQTVLSLRLKAALDRIAPRGTPRHFVVNTGAEAVENAIKSVLLVRASTGEKDGGFIVSFEGAFHGRTLGALAVTHRRRARSGFPTFDWPQAIFPTDDPRAPAATARREERSLRQVWELLVSGRLPGAVKSKENFLAELERIDAFLAASGGDAAAFVAGEHAALEPELRARARRVAAVLIEPIQGEGGVRMARPSFFRRLRLFTAIYDVPLIFDEVQTGFGATGTLWAHEQLDLPLPPDVVTWAKKAQNGVLFVSEELAVFFQEEKKFNTTWEGDSTGMARLLGLIEQLDLEQVRNTGALARTGLEALAREHKDLVKEVRGAGVMLAFDVARSDWRDVLADRAFRRGLILLPASERTLRFYPRYDTSPASIAEALDLLRQAVSDILEGGAQVPLGPRLRVGELPVPLVSAEVIDLGVDRFAELRTAIMAVEIARYGPLSNYPPDVLRAGRRPLVQYPVEALEAAIAGPRAAGVALRDGVSGRIIAYALGGPLESYDEEGVRDDPHYGEGNTFYLMATATLPSVQNAAEVENHMLEGLRARVCELGYRWLSALVEEGLHKTGPTWLRESELLRTSENFLRSGQTFVYLQAGFAASEA
jgi:4-aminobutyrate aminotransferase/(S)-3-amino-2-methylpropionate transaminase